MELLGGQNCFPCSHLSEFFDVPAGWNSSLMSRIVVALLNRHLTIHTDDRPL